MGLSLLQKEEGEIPYNIEDGECFEFELHIPVYLSGSDWASEYDNQGGS